MVIHALIKNYINEVKSPLNKMLVNLNNDEKETLIKSFEEGGGYIRAGSWNDCLIENNFQI